MSWSGGWTVPFEISQPTPTMVLHGGPSCCFGSYCFMNPSKFFAEQLEELGVFAFRCVRSEGDTSVNHLGGNDRLSGLADSLEASVPSRPRGRGGDGADATADDAGADAVSICARRSQGRRADLGGVAHSAVSASVGLVGTVSPADVLPQARERVTLSADGSLG